MTEEKKELIVSSIHRNSKNERIGDLKDDLEERWEQTKEWTNTPFLDALTSQWILAIIWGMLTLVSLGVVWHPEAHTHWDGNGCESHHGNANLLVLLFLIHFAICVFCAWRLKHALEDILVDVWIPFFGLYGTFPSTQALYKMMILLTSGLGIASSLRTYYLLSHDAEGGFTTESGFLFMISIALLAFVAIFQLEPETAQRMYFNADIDIRFWKGGAVLSQFLHMFSTFIVIGMGIIHMARYKPPKSCVDGTDGGRWSLFLFTLASAGATVISLMYIFLRPKSSIDYDYVDIIMRNILGLGSHLMFFCFFIYILLYFAMGISIADLQQIENES
jgi:hypothetical protein